jgi:Tfp pilus assembly PilM family ATPase
MSLLNMFRTAAPDVALEIDHTHVAAARMSWRGREAVVAAHAVEQLPDGLVAPGLLAPNIADVPAVSQAIGRVLTALGGRSSRVGLVIPDTVSKVSLVKLEKVPARSADLQEIVRWQMKKTSPFPLDQATISIAPGAKAADGGAEFVVTLVRTDVVQQYEQACAMAGAHAGLVDLSTFGVLNGVLSGTSSPSGDWLLVHVTDTYLSLAVMRDQALLFFRNRGEEAEVTLADLIHQTAMYYEDRLRGGGFARVLIAGGARLPGGAEHVRLGLEERLRVSVESVDPRAAAALQDRINAAPELLDLLAPLVGTLMRERAAA